MKESNRYLDEVFIRISLQNREFSRIIVYVGGAGASEWDTIPYMAGTLVCERKNELLEGLFFLFFSFHKNYIGRKRNGQEDKVLLPAALCRR